MTREQDLSLFGGKPEELNPYERHFLLKNPFPGYGETGELDVCTDQNTIKKKFVSLVQPFNSEAKRLRINGQNGAGKTNILRYFEWLTNEARWSGLIKKKIYPIYVYAPGESYFHIHEQIVDKLSELFLGDLLKALQSDPQQIDELLNGVKQASELLVAVKALVRNSNTLFTIYGERHEDTFIRWLKGQKLSAADKKSLSHAGTPPADITIPSLAIRFLSGLLEVLKELDLCDGIVLLFDEFEEIFEGLTRSRQSRYAQDLRHFFDTLKEAFFFVVVTVPEPRDLSQYPAIERRLGEPLELQPIDSLELAAEYVEDYLNSGRDKYGAYWKTHRQEGELHRPHGLEPLTKDDVEQEYYQLNQETEKAELDVLPGVFLPRMRERIKEIVEDKP